MLWIWGAHTYSQTQAAHSQSSKAPARAHPQENIFICGRRTYKCVWWGNMCAEKWLNIVEREAGWRGCFFHHLLLVATWKKASIPRKTAWNFIFIYTDGASVQENIKHEKGSAQERERKCESNPFVLLLKLATQLSVRRTTTHHSLLGWRLKSAQMFFLFSVAARTNTSRATFVHI